MKKQINILVILITCLISCFYNSCQNPVSNSKIENTGFNLPKLHTNNKVINKAFRIAIGDLFTNIQDYEISITDTCAPVILAGLEYDRPWTRDAAINSWNAGSFIVPDIAKNTLLSVLTNENDTIRIGGQYWDAIETLDKSTKIRWNMVTSSNVSLRNKEATLTDGGKILYLKVQGPDNIQMLTWSTAPTNNYDAENPGTIMVGFECEIPANTSEAFEVMLVPKPVESEATFLNITLDKW